MKKSALILLVAVAISTVSCVDNAESPLVGALRSQQVEWMKAKTAGEVAANEMKTIANSYAVASNAIALKTEDATYAALVAANEELAMQAKLAIAVAKTKLDAELADAAIAMAIAGDQKGIEYLKRYTAEAKSLALLIVTRVETQELIVANEIIVAKNPADIKAYVALAQKNIDAQNAKIAGAEAAIAVYKESTTGTDVTTFETEKAALDLKNRTLAIANVRLNYDSERNKLVFDEQDKEVVTLKATRKTQDDSRVTKSNEKTDLESKTPKDDAAIAKLTKEINDLVASIKVIDDKVIALDASSKILRDKNVENGLAITANLALDTKNDAIIEALDDVILRLSTTIIAGAPSTISIADEIKRQEGIISGAKTAIGEATVLLSATSEKAKLVAAQKIVVTQTAKLATVNVEITAQEKIVAYWKGLLDKIFTA